MRTFLIIAILVAMTASGDALDIEDDALDIDSAQGIGIGRTAMKVAVITRRRRHPTKSPTTSKAPTKAPTSGPWTAANWQQCISEGGTKDCARCRGAVHNSGAAPGKSGAMVSTGMLPCDLIPAHNIKTSANCPDTFDTGTFFVPNGETLKANCFSVANIFAYKGIVLNNWHFPQIGSGLNSQGKNLISTKVHVTHPHQASKNVGIAVMKRTVTHLHSVTGKLVADEMKTGWCVKCPTNVFAMVGADKATEAEQAAFAACLAGAFDTGGVYHRLKTSPHDYRCTGNDKAYALAAIALF